MHEQKFTSQVLLHGRQENTTILIPGRQLDGLDLSQEATQCTLHLRSFLSRLGDQQT